jgi:RNA polymerase sigma-70 factor (ECF subfamily)
MNIATVQVLVKGAVAMNWYGVDLRWAYCDLFTSIHRQTLCKQNALDILHDSLIRFALAKNPKRTEQPHAFLQIIVRNLLIDDYHHNRRFVSFDIEAGEGNAFANLHYSGSEESFSPSPEHIADINQRLLEMQALIDSLPPRCREVFWLYRIEGLNQIQIAEKLGITAVMANRHVAKALVALAEANDLIY